MSYATEAARAVVDAAVATGRKRLWSTVGAWNRPSLRVLETDAPEAQWRKYPSAGMVWNQADARAVVGEVERKGALFIVDADEITTPYTSDTNGRKLSPDTPYVGSHRFVFERDGDDWRLVQDLTDQLSK